MNDFNLAKTVQNMQKNKRLDNKIEKFYKMLLHGFSSFKPFVNRQTLNLGDH